MVELGWPFPTKSAKHMAAGRTSVAGQRSSTLMGPEPGADDAPFILRPLVPRLWAIGGWIIVALGIFVISGLVIRGRPSPSVSGISVALAVGVGGSAWSASRLAFSVSSHGVEIRNVICTWSYRWDELAEVGFKYVGLPLDVSQRIPKLLQLRTPPAIGIRLRNGKYVPAAQATAYLSELSRQKLIDVLTAEAEAHGVEVTVQASDLAGPW